MRENASRHKFDTKGRSFRTSLISDATDLTQDEADISLAMKKHCFEKKPYFFPSGGGKIRIPLIASNKREHFMLVVNSMRLNLQKYNFNTLTKKWYPLYGTNGTFFLCELCVFFASFAVKSFCLTAKDAKDAQGAQSPISCRFQYSNTKFTCISQ